MDLRQGGYRYGHVAGRFLWVHNLEVPAGFVDCSDMDDAAFERVVVELGAAARVA